ncbi:hypothetical protein HanPSC8_Chr00c240g0806791 [Helianthus annuus]|nr:hypothetical protein HanPSC8_Chr00c240g0806791 [Helianthus annuus]
MFLLFKFWSSFYIWVPVSKIIPGFCYGSYLICVGLSDRHGGRKKARKFLGVGKTLTTSTKLNGKTLIRF